jgi:hypothetical protein
MNCVRADQHLQRLLLRPVHAQLAEQAQAVDRELERLVPLLRRRRPLPPRQDLAFYQRGGTFQNYYMVIPPFHVQQLCFYCLASLPDRPNVKSARSAYSRSCCCIFSNSG